MFFYNNSIYSSNETNCFLNCGQYNGKYIYNFELKGSHGHERNVVGVTMHMY